MEQLKAADEGRDEKMEDKSKLNIEMSQEECVGSSVGPGPKYVCSINPVEGSSGIDMYPSDWNSLAFHHNNVDGNFTFTSNIGRINCYNYIPEHIDRKVAAAVLVSTKEVWFMSGFTLETDLLAAMVAAMEKDLVATMVTAMEKDLVATLATAGQTNRNNTLEKVVVFNVKLEASPRVMAQFLSLIKRVELEWTVMGGQAWEEWGTAHLNKMHNGTQVTEGITLSGVVVPEEVDPDVVAALLSGVPTVSLEYTKMSSKIWDEWGTAHLNKMHNDTQVTVEITLWSVVIPEEVDPDVVGALLCSVPTVALWGRTTMPEDLWKAWSQQIMKRKEEGTCRLKELKLVAVKGETKKQGENIKIQLSRV